MAICPEDTQCADNCGTVIKKGEECVKLNSYNKGWHVQYRCEGCQDYWDKDQEREDAMSALD